MERTATSREQSNQRKPNEMKKTVNINLAGTFFHIDEDAFGKLSRYLDAIKKSLSDPQGNDEIIRDIEARIAELFSEKTETTAQVISLKELDAVIAIMGQPEDYMVDEEIFEDAPPTSNSRVKSRSYGSHSQLFRDIDNKFIGGVCSGLAHYLKVDSIWIRLLFILLTLVTQGFFIIVYFLFWILVPAAISISDKLKMTREPVNISNIEKKFKEGYDAVADKMKNTDYDKYGQRIKNGSTDFFDSIGSVLLAILKVGVKIIGVFIILISLVALISLIIGLFTFGSFGFWENTMFSDYFTALDVTGTPFWLLSLLMLFAVGIPFFVLFILGLKLMINNLRTVGTPVKIILLVVWVFSLIGLGVIGARQSMESAYDGEFISENILPITKNDTLRISMRVDTKYSNGSSSLNNLKIRTTENNEKVIYSNDVRLIVRSTKDASAKIIVKKEAEGNSFIDAKNRAEAIDYEYLLQGNTLEFDKFFITDKINKYRNQQVEITIYVPEGTVLYAGDNTFGYYEYSSRYNILHNASTNHYLKVIEDKVICLDCPELDEDSEMDEMEKASVNNGDWQSEVAEDFNNGSVGASEDEKTSVKQKSNIQEKKTIIEKDTIYINQN